MSKRFVSIWFRYLATDWFSLRQPQLKNIPFVLRTPVHGRMIITAINDSAKRKGILSGTVLADARAVVPELYVLDDRPDLYDKLLRRLAEWCIRFTPFVTVDAPDGLLFDATGCSHLWGGDKAYTESIIKKLTGRGYDVHAAMADTVGAAWAAARFGNKITVIDEGLHMEAMMRFPPESLRIEPEVVQRLHKLGLHKIGQFIKMPRPSLRRRFGQHFIQRLDMALGTTDELLHPVIPVEPYQERLPCLEPIVTATGIEMALDQLLKSLCYRLQQEQKGIRVATLKGYRVDGKTEQITIGTNRPSHHVPHLYKLFELKISTIEPAMGIELFLLEATQIEDHFSQQEKMWETSGGLEDERLSELIDRLGARVGMQAIHRYLPDEHYWPERSFKPASDLREQPATPWRADKLRPLQLLPVPERIDVAAPIPDYPPMLFVYRGEQHEVAKADGPERIEQEWWIQDGQHRDYYRVEDREGRRYWIFRLGHYHDKTYQWFLHGFFH